MAAAYFLAAAVEPVKPATLLVSALIGYSGFVEMAVCDHFPACP